MKISLISNIFPPHVRGGYELGCLELADRLRRDGHEVVVLTSAVIGTLNKTAFQLPNWVHQIFEPVYFFESDLWTALNTSRVWIHMRTESFGGMHASNALAMKNFLDNFNPDVIWIFFPVGLGPIGIMETALCYNARVLIHLMDDFDQYMLGLRRNQFWLGRFRSLKKRFHAIACSKKIARLNEKIGTYGKTTVVYNGYDFELDRKINDPGNKRMDGPFRFYYAGQIEEIKGLLQVIHGAAHLREARPELEFEIHLFGRGSDAFSRKLDKEIIENSLRNYIFQYGFIAKVELLNIATGMDAGIMLLKDDEPFGYAPLEAACLGKPVVLTRKPGIVECISNDFPLLINDRNNAAEVAEKMSWCIEHREFLPTLGEEMHNQLKAHCDFEKITYPGYLKVVETTQPISRKACFETLMASTATSDFYAMHTETAYRFRSIMKTETCFK